jgi:hypothetical protein
VQITGSDSIHPQPSLPHTYFLRSLADGIQEASTVYLHTYIYIYILKYSSSTHIHVCACVFMRHNPLVDNEPNLTTERVFCFRVLLVTWFVLRTISQRLFWGVECTEWMNFRGTMKAEGIILFLWIKWHTHTHPAWVTTSYSGETFQLNGKFYLQFRNIEFKIYIYVDTVNNLLLWEPPSPPPLLLTDTPLPPLGNRHSTHPQCSNWIRNKVTVNVKTRLEWEEQK